MGLFEPDVRHGGRHRKSRLKGHPKAITIHGLRHAQAAALASAKDRRPALLLSAPSAAAIVGPAWFGAVVDAAAAGEPSADLTAALDCGSSPGHALAALRFGLRIVRYDGPVFASVEEIARNYDAVVLRDRPDSLDLARIDPSGDERIEAMARKCGEWLAATA